MSAVTTATATSPDTVGARSHRLAVETVAGADVVIRALTLLRRRGCRILAVDFQTADRHRPGRFEVTVEAPVRVGDRIESWLLGLVDVVAVRERHLGAR